MALQPRDALLPLSPTAIIGGWINDTPWQMQDGGVLRQESSLIFAADGSVSFRGIGAVEPDGRPIFAQPVVIDHAGTWTIESDTLVVQMPTRPTPRFNLVLVEREATDGERRICLKSDGGGVYWRTKPK